MSEKEIGRNDPCPCGSGEKYKHCHAGSAVPLDVSEDAVWRRLRAVFQGHPAMMMRFVEFAYGHEAIEEAWDEFTVWDYDDPHFDPDTPLMEVFLPWFYHHWAPEPPETSIEDLSLHGRSPTGALLERKGSQLNPLLVRYLEACMEAAFSFHEVVRCEPGRGFRTRDVMTGTEREVLERSASRSLQVGDTFYGQLVTAEGVTLIESLGRHAVPPHEKLELIDFRERVGGGSPFSEEMLHEWSTELRAHFIDIMERVLNPQAPGLKNTDGEEIAFLRLRFEIDSPRDAFEALKHLAADLTEEELLADAGLGPDGELRRLAFPWTVPGNAQHKTWSNTVLGEIEIEGRELRAEVNSAERAARLRGILEERLGSRIRHRSTDIQSVEDARPGWPGPLPAPRPDDAPDLENDPEVQARLRELIAAHYEGWVTEPVPALGGRTPLEAVHDRVGREKVEALLTEMERNNASRGGPATEEDFARVRERLGLGRGG